MSVSIKRLRTKGDAEMKDKAIAVQQEVGISVAEVIRTALDKGADMDKLNNVLSFLERLDANRARKAYHEAMAAFKANPPKIKKDRRVAFKDVRYNYASLANVTDSISQALSKHGLSATWKTQQNGQITVTCRITHVLGHSEETAMSAPADVTGSKNAIQAIGSTISYLERYTLLALTGLATDEMDDDGRSGNDPAIDDKQKGQLLDYLAELNIPLSKVLAYAKIETVEELPQSRFKQIIADLEAKRKVAQKK